MYQLFIHYMSNIYIYISRYICVYTQYIFPFFILFHKFPLYHYISLHTITYLIILVDLILSQYISIIYYVWFPSARNPSAGDAGGGALQPQRVRLHGAPRALRLGGTRRGPHGYLYIYTYT